MIKRISNGKIIQDLEVISDSFLYFRDDKILCITKEQMPFDEEIDARGEYISAGFIDIHSHGGGGSDFMDGTPSAFLAAAELHAKHGTTSIVPTTLSGKKEELFASFDAYEKADKINNNGARLSGLHLEGPYFSMNQRGAQDPRYITPPIKEDYEDILERCDKIKRWSAAPELEGSREFAETLLKHDVLPAIAHSDATHEQVLEAFSYGFSHVTHLYSGMSSVHRINAYRFAGVVESAYLIDEMSVEIIADGVHLPKSLLQFVYKFKSLDKIVLVTDSMRGAGQEDGESLLGSLKDGMKCIIEDGVAKLPDRTAFAGSVATADRLVRNMVTLAGASLPESVKMITENPAKLMNMKNVGKLEENYMADIIIFDENINIKKTIIGGKTVFENRL